MTEKADPVPAHSDEVFELHERILGDSPARGQYIDLRSGRRVHVIEAGDGPPVVSLHGSITSSLSLLPLLERLDGVRTIAVDRPGFGLSEPGHVPCGGFRDAAIEFVERRPGRAGIGDLRGRRPVDGGDLGCLARARAPRPRSSARAARFGPPATRNAPPRCRCER